MVKCSSACCIDIHILNGEYPDYHKPANGIS